MPKSKSAPKYKHFKLHGNHKKEKILTYAAIALVVGVILGVIFQPYILNLIYSFY